MKGVLASNYVLIVLLVGFVVLLCNSINSVNLSTRKRARELLIVIIFLVISSALRSVFESLDHYTIGSTITNFICYTFRPAVIILFTSMVSNRKYTKPLSFLCIINTTIYIIGLFNGITFSFTDSNVMIQGPLFYSSHLFCLFYFLVLLSIIVKQHNRQNPMRTITLLSFMIVCCLASCIDINTNEFTLIDTILLICGLEYYLYIYMEHNKIDVLTGAYNRATFYNDIKKLGNKVTSVISIDMNDLKKINDTLGHDEGDKAILTMASVLLSVDQNNVRIYRVGGDEFVALCFYKEKENVKDYIKKAKKDLSKTSYHCSFGFAYRDTCDIFEVYKKADD